MSELSPREAGIKRVDEWAVDAFSQHEITTEMDYGVYRHFRCGRPKSSTYAFNVTTFPGRLIVTGDLGCLVVERVHDMFEWAPSSLESIDYFASKTPREMKVKEFNTEMVKWWLEHDMHNCYEDGTAQVEIRDGLCWLDDMTEGEVYRVIYDATDDCDMPSFWVWESSFLWCRAALRWFFDKRGLGS